MGRRGGDIVQDMPVHARLDEDLRLGRRTHQVDHEDGQAIFQVRVGDAPARSTVRQSNVS